MCCPASPAILWLIVHLRRSISTESTRTTWPLQAWHSSCASGTNLSPTPFTTRSVSYSNAHELVFSLSYLYFSPRMCECVAIHCVLIIKTVCIFCLQTWRSPCLSLSGLQCTTPHRSNTLIDNPCATWTDTEMEKNTPMEFTDYETHGRSWESHTFCSKCWIMFCILCWNNKAFSSVLIMFLVLFLHKVLDNLVESYSGTTRSRQVFIKLTCWNIENFKLKMNFGSPKYMNDE